MTLFPNFEAASAAQPARRLIENKLNDLSGKEWVYSTNSIESFETTEAERDLNKFIVELIETRFPTSGKDAYAHKERKIHPSPKPPQLMERLIRFFTKENEMIFDPFCGVGGTLLGASLCQRKAIGVDLSEKYLEIYQQAANKLSLPLQKTFAANSKNLNQIEELKNVEFDLILTDPPYGNMMARKKTGEATKKKLDTSPTPFTGSTEDIGNLELKDFLTELKKIVQLSFDNLRNKRYVIIFTKDFQPKSEYHGMLHFDIMRTLSEIEGLKYKGMKIWYDKTVNLYPYGYPYAYVGNQLHQYILIFRKEAK